MSAVPGAAETGARGTRAQAQRTAEAAARLKLVAPPATRASSGAFVLLLTGLLGVGLLGLLAVNTVLAQGSFTTTDLATKQDALAQQEQQLQQEVALLQSPQQLAAAAAALGMVGTHNPVFIDTRTGKILGVPQAAPRPAPTPAATTGPTAGAAPGATPGATTPGATTPGVSSGPTTTARAGSTAKPSPHPSPTGAR